MDHETEKVRLTLLFSQSLPTEDFMSIFQQKIERSDSNAILETYFRPRRAAELIHQNKTVNCWKDYAKRNNQTNNNWMTPSALPNNMPTINAALWQPIPIVSAFPTLRSGNLLDNPKRTVNSSRRVHSNGIRDLQQMLK